MTNPLPIGLLLDVDGPVASPVSRTVRPGIIADLLTLAQAGWPIVFNTGRSDTFVQDQLMKPMLAAGIPTGVQFHAVCEKGAVWFSFDSRGASGLHVDDQLVLSSTVGDAIRQLVQEKYSSHMFFDETKRAMVSVEQQVEVDNAGYLAEQKKFDVDAMEIMERHGMSVCRLSHHTPDSDDNVDFRIDPSIIATDVESVRVGKDLGAERALQLIGTNMPAEWRTVGDSRTDYAMADYLHEHGHNVSHVDVRPADGVPEKPYRILTEGELINDDAGAAFLSSCVQSLKG